jgi:hypothetical protein
MRQEIAAFCAHVTQETSGMLFNKLNLASTDLRDVSFVSSS